MFSQTSMGLIYLIFNQLPFLWDTSVFFYNLNNHLAEKCNVTVVMAYALLYFTDRSLDLE